MTELHNPSHFQPPWCTSLKSPLPVLRTLNNEAKQTLFPVRLRTWENGPATGDESSCQSLSPSPGLDLPYLRRKNCPWWHHFTSWMSHGRTADGVFCRKGRLCMPQHLAGSSGVFPALFVCLTNKSEHHLQEITAMHVMCLLWGFEISKI